MIASRLGLWIVAGVALLLAVFVAIDMRRDVKPTSHVLVEDFDAAKVTRISFTRQGEPEHVIERVRSPSPSPSPPGGGSSSISGGGSSSPMSPMSSGGVGEWRWVKPIAGLRAEPAAIDSLFAALRGGRWHRRAELSKAGALRAAVALQYGTKMLKLGVGAVLEGAGQTWIAIGERAYLVDDWIARAIAPDPLALRETRPFRDAATAERIVIERSLPRQSSVRLEGSPRRMTRPIELLLEPQIASTLHRGLADITIEGTPVIVKSMPKPAVPLVVSVDGPPLATIEFLFEIDRGSQVDCNGNQHAIGGTFGRACASGGSLKAITDALDLLHSSPAALVEHRPVPIDPISIVLPDGATLALDARPRIGDRDADSARVAELLLVLQTKLEAVDVPPAAKVVGTLVATDRAGTKIELEVLAGKQVRRKNEPIALAVGEGAWAILMRPSSALRDPTLWTEDPTTITKLTIDKTVYERGAVVGEWKRVGTGRDDNEVVTSLARLLATLRGTDAKVGPMRRTLSFEVTPPSGAAPTTRTLQIGARRANGCDAIVDGTPMLVDVGVCDAVGKLVP